MMRCRGWPLAATPLVIALLWWIPLEAAAQPAAPLNELVAALDGAVPGIMQDHDIPGAAMVLVSHGDVVLERGWGLADVDAGTPVDPGGTVFRIGSVTKFLTALAVVQLEARGQLRLSDPLSRRPGMEPPSNGRWPEGLRVEHLLSHSGGFDQTGRGRRASSKQSRASLAEFVRNEVVPLRVPGWASTYDTYGITVAGRLIEVVTGRPFGDYMREEVFEALGMYDTWVEIPADRSSHLATGYGLTNDELTPLAYEWYTTLPASSVDATVSDMGRLLVALLGGHDGPGRRLGPGVVAKIQTPQRLSGGAEAPFTHGLWEASIGGTRALHHGGLMQGFESDLYMFPTLGLGYFIAYNRDRETGPPPGLREAVHDLVVQHLLSEEPVMDPGSAPSPRIDVTGFAGAYANTLGCFTCPSPGSGWGVSFVRLEVDGPGRLRTPNNTWTALGDSVLEDGQGRRARFVRSPDGVTYLIQGVNAYARVDEPLLRQALGPDWRDYEESTLVRAHLTAPPPEPPELSPAGLETGGQGTGPPPTRLPTSP